MLIPAATRESREGRGDHLRVCSVAYPGGGSGCSNTPSASTSLIIHYSQSTYDSLHDTAQLAPAPSEKTITGAASSRYPLEVDRTGEQSAGLRAIRITTILTLEATPTHDLRMRKITTEHPLSLILDTPLLLLAR